MERDMAFGAKSSGKHRFLDIAALGNPQSSAPIWNTEFFAKHFNRPGDSTNGINRNRAPVLGLISPWNPFYVARVVSFIVFNSLYRIACRARTDVFRERLKIVTPRSKNFNLSTAIVFVSRIIRVITSPVHVQPALVCATFCLGLAVSLMGENPQASTRLSSSALNVGFSSDEQSAAKAAIFSTDFINAPNEFRVGNLVSVVFSVVRHNDGLNIVVFSSGGQLQLPVAAPYYLQEVITVNS